MSGSAQTQDFAGAAGGRDEETYSKYAAGVRKIVSELEAAPACKVKICGHFLVFNVGFGGENVI